MKFCLIFRVLALIGIVGFWSAGFAGGACAAVEAAPNGSSMRDPIVTTPVQHPHHHKHVAPSVHVTRSVDDIKRIIAQEAAAQGVPALLAEAIVQHESRFQPGARAEGNTIGLMQIKLGTARGMGYHGDAEGLFVPENNLHFGIAYLGQAWRLSRGDVCGALARYAGGFKVTRVGGPVKAFCVMAKEYMHRNEKA